MSTELVNNTRVWFGTKVIDTLDLNEGVNCANMAVEIERTEQKPYGE